MTHGHWSEGSRLFPANQDTLPHLVDTGITKTSSKRGD